MRKWFRAILISCCLFAAAGLRACSCPPFLGDPGLELEVTNKSRYELVVYAGVYSENSPQSLLPYLVGVIPPGETVKKTFGGLFLDSIPFKLIAQENVGQKIYQGDEVVPTSSFSAYEMYYMQTVEWDGTAKYRYEFTIR